MNNSEPNRAKLIRPLSDAEAVQLANFYKKLSLDSIQKTKKSSTEKEKILGLLEKLNDRSCLQNEIDPKCKLKIDKRFVRIEYPGEVKNVDKAIATLGGMHSIETAVVNHKQKLQLSYHPDNKFNKPCTADRDLKPGILIRVKKSSLRPAAGSSRNDEKIEPVIEVLGSSVMNFTFTSKLCDYQYLPLIAKDQETKESKTEFIYKEILPDHVPDEKWLRNEQAKNMPLFLNPVRFAIHDTSDKKLHIDDDDPRFNLDVLDKSGTASKKKEKLSRIFGKNRAQLSIFVNFKDKNVPTKPPDELLKVLKIRNVDQHIAKIKKLFEERPIWTKAGLMYNANINPEQAKLVLPTTAYHFPSGPWRGCWVKFGYDPRTDPDSRIYQSFDYRIRTAENAQIKVKAKRGYTNKSFAHLPADKRISLKDNIAARPKFELDERCYIFKPNVVPPARQMFYQFCDILLPRIQERLSRLPRVHYCDPKYGWLPRDFVDECRDIVNDYVMRAVQKEIAEDNRVQEQRNISEQRERKEQEKQQPVTALDYCSQMLNKVKQGMFKSVAWDQAAVAGSSFSRQGRKQENIDLENIESIDLSDDDDDEYEDALTVGDIIRESIPEKLIEEEEDEDAEMDLMGQDGYGLNYETDDDQHFEEDDDEDDDISMATVNEINQMIYGTNEENEERTPP